MFSQLLVTSCIFPGTIFYFRSEKGKDSLMQNWLPVLLGFSYYLSGYLGRSFGKSILINEVKIGFWSLIRLIFIPLIMICIKPRFLIVLFNTNSNRLIVNDFLVILLIFGLSFTQGYLLSCSMILAPGKCDPSEKSLASQMMTFFLCFGINIGSNFGILLSQIYT